MSAPKRKPLFMGIDPGLHGAVAVLDTTTRAVTIHDMPTLEIKGKTRLDMHALHNLLGDLLAGCGMPATAMVEDVHAMPAQGVVSSFNFGFTAGATQMALAASRIPIHLVAPGTWKRIMGLSADKDASRAKASQLYPEHTELWARKKDDGRAEALLLAHYAARASAVA